MVILLLGITIMIMIHKNHHCTSKNQSPLSSWESAKETLDYYEAFKIKKLFSTRLKRSAEEQLIPKIKITAARLEKIKNYIFRNLLILLYYQLIYQNKNKKKLINLKRVGDCV